MMKLKIQYMRSNVKFKFEIMKYLLEYQQKYYEQIKKTEMKLKERPREGAQT